MKRRRWLVVLVASALVVTAALAWIWPQLWRPVTSASAAIDNVPWVGSEIVKSSANSHRYYVFERSVHREMGYMVDLNEISISLPPMSFWRLWGAVLPKESNFSGVLMSPMEEKAPFDPELKLARDRKSFTFRCSPTPYLNQWPIAQDKAARTVRDKILMLDK